MPEDHLHRSMLLDYYGDLLTARQRECYELHFNEDLSLSEIATMEELEEKTGLIQRTLETDRHLRTLEKLLDRLEAQFRKAVPEKAAPNAGSRQEDEANPDIVRLLQEARNEVHTLLKTEN